MTSLDTLFNRFHTHLVPAQGKAATDAGNLLRAVGNLTYDYSNNGHCNAYVTGYYHFDDKDEDTILSWDEDDFSWYDVYVRSDFQGYLDLLSELVPETSDDCHAIRMTILRAGAKVECTFSEIEQLPYKNIERKVVAFVIACGPHLLRLFNTQDIMKRHADQDNSSRVGG